jgi:carbamoyl-phosphate synthase large subunit
VNDSDKATLTPIARRFHEMGFVLYATAGTAAHLQSQDIPCVSTFKIHEGRPNCFDLIVNRQVQLLVNTPYGKHAQRDDYTMRQAAERHHLPYTTTLSAASAAAEAVHSLRERPASVRSLQEWQSQLRAPIAAE